MHTNSPLMWSDEIRSSRCKLPKSNHPFLKFPVFLGIGFSLFFAGGPIIMILFFIVMVPAEVKQSDQFYWFLLGVGALMGVFLFPIVAFVLQRSILMGFGHKEIVVDETRLRVISRAGPFWSTRSCALSDLGGFRVEDPRGERFQFLEDGYANLVAVRKNGRSIHLLRMYPRGTVDQLCQDLPKTIERMTSRAFAKNDERITAENLNLEHVFPDPTKIDKREGKPIGSNLLLEERGNELLLKIPALGFGKSTSRFIKLWVAGFVFFQMILTFGLVPALIAGKVEGQPSAGWVIVVVFSLVFVGIVLALMNAAIRKGSIRVNDDYVTFSQSGLFGQREERWMITSTEEVRVAFEETESDEGVSWTHYLQVVPDHHKEKYWFSFREKPELEWMATCVNNRLSGKANEGET